LNKSEGFPTSGNDNENKYSVVLGFRILFSLSPLTEKSLQYSCAFFFKHPRKHLYLVVESLVGEQSIETVYGTAFFIPAAVNEPP
jgi:hypothetical protein